jgi:exodeoxyribonuclease VII large subunit
LQHTHNTIQTKIYTVSRLTSEIKSLLEDHYPFVWITGEISNFSIPVSGHFYFTLKDKDAQISAVMFRGQNKNLKFMPEHGMSITGLGRLSLYEPRGNYQIIFELLEPKGIGSLQVAFEQLKTRLMQEGLFEDEHKKPLPYLPRKICIITSPTGAVVHDIINILNRRFPNICINILPVKVQGDAAEKGIVAALEFLNELPDIDVGILARGGGSLEDLNAFNTEGVARTIFQSHVPIISAVGHETDFTIADFVADLRAPTPSAAAELVVPLKQDLKQRCLNINKALFDFFSNHIEYFSFIIKELKKRLVNPKKRIQDHRLKLDDLTTRLIRRFHMNIQQRRERLTWHHDRLFANTPLSQITLVNEKLDIFNNNLLYYIRILLKHKRYHLNEILAKIEALNPESILDRGYSITRTIPGATIVKNADSVEIDQNVEVMLAKGVLICRVGGKSTHGEKNI